MLSDPLQLFFFLFLLAIPMLLVDAGRPALSEYISRVLKYLDKSLTIKRCIVYTKFKACSAIGPELRVH
jgi:hypothetical protein